MTKRILFIFCFVLNCSVYAQTDLIETINISDIYNSEDFSFLEKELKDAQIVLLGEITHNDGNVFEFKTEIIKYLYNKMGFKTIAFESGTYEMWKAQQEIEKGENATTAFQNSLFPIWSKTVEFQPFIDFFEKNKIDLKLYGFDNQITGKYGEEELITDLYNYCEKEKLSIGLNQTDLELLIESMLYSGIFDEKDISHKAYNNALNTLLQDISEKQINEIHFYWNQIIKNLISLGEEYYAKKQPIVSTFYVSKDDNLRDEQMADNLLAYISEHPNEKIICWGANQHFINNMSSIMSDTIKDFIPMGSYLKNVLKDKVYSLATITAQDSIKLGGKWHKTLVDKASFEWFLKQKNEPYLFISSKQKNLDNEKLNRFFSPITFINSNLSQLHDGYIFLDKTIPSTFIPENSREINKNESIQNKISGRIFDKKSKEPLAFANILIKASYIGTSTNEDGYFELYFPNSLKNKSVIISSLGYESQTIDFENITPKIELNSEATSLDEVIITSKLSANAIVSKAIENFDKNYPLQHYNADIYTNAQIKLKDTIILDLDVISNYYNRGYKKAYRPTQNIKEIRWNIKTVKPNNKMRYFFTNTYNSVANIQFISQKRKLKKFTFVKEKEEVYHGKDIYIIRFNTDRNHFNYTNKSYFSEFSGFLYINKEDFSIVKIIENWNVTDYPDDLKSYYENFSDKFTFNKIIKASLESNYRLEKNGKYYLEKTIYKTTGELFEENKPLEFEKTLNSFWYNINSENVTEISFKSEDDEFNNVKYNKKFWSTYQFPDKF
ncbi:MAG: erythromycin esterase family protein [Aequorivita sp.]